MLQGGREGGTFIFTTEMKTGISRRTEKERLLFKVGGISIFEQKQKALEKQIKKGEGTYIHLMRLPLRQ